MRIGSWVVAFAFLVSMFSFPGGAYGQQTMLASDGDNLLSIDLQTFAVTLVGPLPFATSVEYTFGAMELDAEGTLWAMSSHRLYRVDPDTGQTFSVGPFNVSGLVFEGGLAFHPMTGVAYAANYGSQNAAQLMRVDLLTGNCTLLGGFPNPGNNHDFNGLTFGPGGELFGIDRPSNSLWKIDPLNTSGPGSSIVGGGLGASITMSWGGGMTYDAVSDTLWGYAVGSHALFTVDPVTGSATIVKQFDGSVPPLAAISIGECTTNFAYGAGCAGSGGFVPKMNLDPCVAQAGQAVQLAIRDALGGSTALLVFGLAQGATPIGGGCSLYVQPLLPPIVAIPLGGIGAGDGSAFLSAVIPTGLPTPYSFTMQAFVADPSVPTSFASTSGMQVTVLM